MTQHKSFLKFLSSSFILFLLQSTSCSLIISSVKSHDSQHPKQSFKILEPEKQPQTLCEGSVLTDALFYPLKM